MKANFKTIFGFTGILGTAIAAIASIGTSVVDYKERKSTDDGHVPTEDEAKALAESCPENTEEQMIKDVIEENEDKEETNN